MFVYVDVMMFFEWDVDDVFFVCVCEYFLDDVLVEFIVVIVWENVLSKFNCVLCVLL